MFPAPRSCLAKMTSATLMHAVATAAVPQTTSTVTSGRELTTSPSPSRSSRQWPFVMRSSERSAAAGIRETSAAERRNVTAFAQYATSTPFEASNRPAIAGPIVHATFSTVVSSDVACSRSSSSTRFGRPAQTAGRKKPVATPFTAATATIARGSSTNGSRTNVAARTRSDTIIRRLRDSRSTSGPIVSPIRMIGRKSAIRSAASQRPEPVWSYTWTDSVERREVRAYRRPGSRPEQQGEATVPAKEGQTACRSEEHAVKLPPPRRRATVAESAMDAEADRHRRWVYEAVPTAVEYCTVPPVPCRRACARARSA